MKYTTFGNLYRYHGVVSTFFLILFAFFANKYNPEVNEVDFSSIFFMVLIVFVYALIYLWFHPVITVNSMGITIRRISVVTRSIPWDSLTLHKKVRGISRYGLIGLDPRYAILYINDATFIDKKIFLLSWSHEFDQSIAFIEDKIGRERVFTDKGYRSI